MRLISLSALYVLKTPSTQRNQPKTLVDVVVADLDEDRHSHHVLDAVHQTFSAVRSAACSDRWNA